MATRLTNTTNNIPILNQALQDIDVLKKQVADLQTTTTRTALPVVFQGALNFGTIAAKGSVTLNVAIPNVDKDSAAFASPNAALTNPAAGAVVWCAAVRNNGIVAVQMTNTDQTNSATPGAVLWTIIVI